MARFDVFEDEDGYLFMDVRADQFETMRRLILIPLLPVSSAPPPIRDINPIVDVDERPHRLMTQYVASVPHSAFRNPVANLARYRDDVTRALDVLLTGF